MQEFINSIPEFMWDHIFSVINTLICGLIVAFFTSTFLRKKEERTRIAGVIVEKRINSEQQVLHFLERELFKEEINIENSSKYDVVFSDLLNKYNLPDPYRGHIQYAFIFKKMESFNKFFHKFEDEIMTHKLWLDTNVKTHLVFMQLYFGFFNTIPLMIKRIPLPEGKELTNEEFNEICDMILWLLGMSCDGEINSLMSELDEKIVDSVYKLELNRPKRSMMRDNMYNVDMKKLMKRFEKKTIPGLFLENIYNLIMDLVYQKKEIDDSKMTNEEYDEFLKSSNPKDYAELQEEFQYFKETIEQIAKENDVKIARKSDIINYPNPDHYGMNFRDAIEGKNPRKIKDIINNGEEN